MRPVLLRGATIVTMATGRPDAERADILVEGDRIAAIGLGLERPDAEVVDFSGRILIPGLVNAHIHTWQTGLRSIGADWTLLEYLSKVHGGLAAQFTADDMGIAALACALNQINCGVTTIGDWCHNARTPDHADATIEGLMQAGVRAVYLHGGSHKLREVAQPAPDIDRLLNGPAARHALLDVGMAIPGPQYSSAEVALADFRTARERDLIVSMHQSGGRPGPAWEKVRDAGLVSPRTNIVHGNDIPDDWIKTLVDAGGSFTSTPENELGQGHGAPITGRLMRLGAAPSLGTDIDTCVSGEILIAARIALAQQRGLDHAEHRQRTGLFSPTPTITSKQALSWAGVQGARALGLADRVGRLEPGLQADIVAIDARALNLWPAHDPIAAVLHASIANIEAVMIAGRWRKRDHVLVDVKLDEIRSRLTESGRRLTGALQATGLVARLRRKVVRHVVHGSLRKQSRA